MSIFTSHVTETVALANAQSVVIRKLAPKHLELARKANLHASMRDLRDMGGPAFMKEIQSALSDPTMAKAVADPMNLYDRQILIEKGIVSWSFDEPVTPETVADVEEDVQERIARAVLRLAKPSLFQTKEEVEAERKNG